MNAPPELPADLSSRVLAWQARAGRRDLPWLGERDPYRVWLSEIMLQQTQVETVRGYYLRFLERFPDVQALAQAPVDAVLAAWSGLGYYRRAHHLHECAKTVVREHGGRFPARASLLAALPGIGPSTAAAIAAFCFGERAAILDGNVKRVLARVSGYGEDLARAPAERSLWQAATQALPAEARDMPAYTQGLMDLGATVCLPRQPHCADCPLAGTCSAQRDGRTGELPLKTRKLRRRQQPMHWLCLSRGRKEIWLAPRPQAGIWSGLWCVPVFESEDALRAALAAAGMCGSADAPPGDALRALSPFTHVLTHLDLQIQPWHLPWPSGQGDEPRGMPGRWHPLTQALGLGLPAPLRTLLEAWDQ